MRGKSVGGDLIITSPETSVENERKCVGGDLIAGVRSPEDERAEQREVDEGVECALHEAANEGSRDREHQGDRCHGSGSFPSGSAGG